MLRTFYAPLVVATLFSCCSLQAQAAEDDIGIWTVFSTTDVIPSDAGPDRWSYAFDAQARYFDIGTGINQYLVRPSIGYKPGDNLQFWLGYAHIWSRNRAGAKLDEDRLFQQINWAAGNAFGGAISMRTRLLQRTLSSSDDTAVVFRIMAKYTRPLTTDGSRNLLISVEPFFNLNDTDWAGQSGLIQHRIAAGVGWKIHDKLTIETSYMNQYNLRENAVDVSNHLAVINFKVKF